MNVVDGGEIITSIDKISTRWKNVRRRDVSLLGPKWYKFSHGEIEMLLLELYSHYIHH